MADAAAFMEAAGSRFTDLELIGRGSFGDVYKGHEFYQKPEEVVVTIFSNGIVANSVFVNYGEQIIVPVKCRYVVLSTKVEIRLAKAELIQRTSLEFGEKSSVAQPINVSTGNQRPSYPSSRPTKDWDKLEAQVKKEEKKQQQHQRQQEMWQNLWQSSMQIPSDSRVQNHQKSSSQG